MNTSTVSAKYQVVIPKELRKKLQIKPGQKIMMKQNKKGDIVINTKSPTDEFYGMLADRNIWGKDPAKTIRTMRDEWDD